jgi:transcriptional regulator with XRE-family HTH domain
VTLEALAGHIGISRPAMMKLVARRTSGRSRPTAGTALKLATAFGVEVRDLYDEPGNCLGAVVEAFHVAPVRQAADVPEGGLSPQSYFALTSGDQEQANGLDGRASRRKSLSVVPKDGR